MRTTFHDGKTLGIPTLYLLKMPSSGLVASFVPNQRLPHKLVLSPAEYKPRAGYKLRVGISGKKKAE